MRSQYTLAVLLGLCLSCSPPRPTPPRSGPAPPEAIQLIPGAWTELLTFAGSGEITVTDDEIRIGMGESLTGVVWEEDLLPLPLIDYEISLEAKRQDGVDFFCGLTFPIGSTDTCSTLVVGGWGGGLVGISSIDGQDASENATQSFHRFEDDRWYRIRLQVRGDAIQAWIDEKLIINTPTAGHEFGMRHGDIEYCMPLGLATFQTRAAIRNIQVRELESATHTSDSSG